jgi:DNA helicase-2/ATP-dependent DNA helicase PcrA
MSQNRMINKENRKKFEEVMGNVGLNVSANIEVDLDDFDRRSIPLHLHRVSQNRMESIENVYNKGIYDASLSDIKYVINNYEKFKSIYRIYDFQDLLVKVLEDKNIQPLDVDVLFLDEFQDSPLLQQEVINKLFKNVKKKYIAGDFLQTIYSWNGVDIDNFINLKYDNKIILDTSYRLPPNILDFSKKIVQRMPKKYQFDIPSKTVKPDGRIERIFDIDNIKEFIIESLHKKESIFILVRNRYLGQMFKDQLLEFGIPYTYFNHYSYTPYTLSTIVDYEDYRKGRIELTEKLESRFKEFMDCINKDKNWIESFCYLPFDEAEYYRRIKGNGFNIKKLLKDKPLIEIGTVHSIKGREADHVIVLPDMSNLTHKMSEFNNGEESRVFYVASTRSRKSLFLMEPVSQLYYDLNF